MKQYLKMADVFEKEVLVEKSIAYTLKNEIDKFYRVREVNDDTLMCSGGDVASYAAHAINSHDELVKMNQELLAALKRVVGDVRDLADHSYGVHGLHQNGDLAPWNSLFSGGFFESWLLSVDDADAVIAKTEGGAA